MTARLLLFTLIFTQCTSSINLSKKQLSDAQASYVRYIPGAGGGKGILFKVALKETPEDLQIDRFVVNTIEVPATVSDSLIVASVFYADIEPSMDNPNPEPVDAILFNQSEFEAIIYFSSQGKNDSVQIKHFVEEEEPLLP